MTLNSTRIRWESLPGRQGAFVLDVKEVSNIESSFQYNFFTTEEKSENFVNISMSRPETSASYVAVSFQKPNRTSNANRQANISLVNMIRSLTNSNIRPHKRLNFEKIISENDLGGNVFTGITLSMPNEINDLRNLTKEASMTVINASKPDIQESQSITDFLQSYSKGLREKGFMFGGEVYKSELPKFFKSISNQNLGKKNALNVASYLNYESNVTYYSPILSNIAADISNNSTSVFSNSVSDKSEEIKFIQSNARANKSKNNPLSNYFPTIASSKVYSYNSIIDALNKPLDEFDIKNQLYDNIEYVGFVVKAKVTLENGNVVTLDPEIFINNMCEEVYIANPPYGSNIGVKICAMYAIRIPIYAEDGSDIVKSTGVIFVSGKGVSTISSAVDTTPPPPPQDLSFNLTNQGLEISWSLPFNTQRDISKFRVFKRNNKNEPFTLLKQIDFGGIREKNIPSFLNETPTNVDGRPIMKTFCTDGTFNETSSTIYAVTCVDVHDLTSNYSEQIRVKINPVFNRLETKIFGRIGAYIQYPNMTIEKEIFEGVVKASGYQKAKIYFNPDFLRIYKTISNTQQTEENLLNIDPSDDNLFKLNLINIDLQEQQNLDIVIGEKISISDFDSDDSAIVKSFLDEDTSIT